MLKHTYWSENIGKEMDSMKKRGRARKRPQSANASNERPSPSWWDNYDLFHDGYGYAWGILLVPDGETLDGGRRQRVEHVAIKEEKLAEIWADASMPGNPGQRQRELLVKILEMRLENDAGTSKIRRHGIERGRPLRRPRRRQKDPRRPAARKGISLCKAHDKGKGVPGR